LVSQIDSPVIPETQDTPPPKAKKGRKSKSALFPPAPETSMDNSKAVSEISSVTGDTSRLGTADMDDISIMSLDEGMENVMMRQCS
jgi:hypothetical protein